MQPNIENVATLLKIMYNLWRYIATKSGHSQR